MTNLPDVTAGSLALLSDACRDLEQARTVSEVSAVVDMAEAFRLLADKAGASLDIQNTAAEIRIRAERKGGELLLAEGFGEHGGDRRSSVSVRLEDLGLDKNKSNRWRQLAKVPADTFESHVASVLADGDRELTSAGVRSLLRGDYSPLLSSVSDEWYTPGRYIEAAREVLGGIDLDPASNPKANEVVQAARFYSIDDDGLTQPWAGRVWMNPPYGPLADAFCRRLVDAYEAGDVSAAILLVSGHGTDTERFRRLWDYVLCFTDHRIKFWQPSGDKAAPTHGSVFVYLGPDPDTFEAAFCTFGAVVQRRCGR